MAYDVNQDGLLDVIATVWQSGNVMWYVSGVWVANSRDLRVFFGEDLPGSVLDVFLLSRYV